ncbi:unnamed protein product [Gongylonema pulchrum]|uniref:Skp1_POZ domain-containing protein n=1 Tax=Gongylonema pulchrum TaxID=637853 RepID=A0A183EYV5_9BILA|nr:unnamed protein product [Gongylonema pulchrum]
MCGEGSSAQVEICEVEVDSSFLDSADGLRSLEPLDMQLRSSNPEPAVVLNVDNEQLLSKLVLDCWEKYAA